MFCALLEKISFFVNFLLFFLFFFFLFFFFILDLYIVNSFGFCSSSIISFCFYPGISDCGVCAFLLLFWVCFLRSAVRWRWRVFVIQSDCVVCYLFFLRRELPPISNSNERYETKNMLSCRANVWFWNNSGGSRYWGSVEGLPSQQAGPKSVTFRSGYNAIYTVLSDGY